MGAMMATEYVYILTDSTTEETLLLTRGYDPEAVLSWAREHFDWDALADAYGPAFQEDAWDALSRLDSPCDGDRSSVLEPLGLEVDLEPMEGLIEDALSDAYDGSWYQDALTVHGDTLLSRVGEYVVGTLSIDPARGGWLLAGEPVPYGDIEALTNAVDRLWERCRYDIGKDLAQSVVSGALEEDLGVEVRQGGVRPTGAAASVYLNVTPRGGSAEDAVWIHVVVDTDEAEIRVETPRVRSVYWTVSSAVLALAEAIDRAAG